MRSNLKIPMLCGSGALLEFYDFVLYILFAEQIKTVFFSQIQSEFITNLIVVLVFSIAYIVRPLGGIVMGIMGDKFGRKKTFAFSIMLMGFCCLLMGIMPGYNQIGLAAPLIFVILRITQGFALGGELPGAIVFVYESLEEKRGLGLGILFSFVYLGFLVAHGMKFALLGWFGENAWRAGFISGSLVAVIGLYLRNRLSETKLFEKIHGHEVRFPLGTLLKDKKHARHLVGGLLTMITVAFGGVVTALYLKHYLVSILHKPADQVASVMVYAMIINTVIILACGWLSDHIDYRKILRISYIGLMLGSIPAFYLMQFSMLPGVLLLSFFCMMASGTFMWLLNDIFPTEIRFTGVAACYNFAFALVGGTAPILLEFLIQSIGATTGPIIVAFISGALSLLGLHLTRDAAVRA